MNVDAWIDAAAYGGLFLSAFMSATLLPGSSEAALLALLSSGRGDVALLVGAATMGNVLGSLANWVLGRFFWMFQERRWFPLKGRLYERAIFWGRRYGLWSLLFSWVPVIGDPLTLAAGVLRVNLFHFIILVSLGKSARYIFIVMAFTWWAKS